MKIQAFETRMLQSRSQNRHLRLDT